MVRLVYRVSGVADDNAERLRDKMDGANEGMTIRMGRRREVVRGGGELKMSRKRRGGSREK